MSHASKRGQNLPHASDNKGTGRSLCPGKGLKSRNGPPTCSGGKPCLNPACESVGAMKFAHPGSQNGADGVTTARIQLTEWLDSIEASADGLSESGPFCLCAQCDAPFRAFCRSVAKKRSSGESLASSASTRAAAANAGVTSANTSVCSPKFRRPASSSSASPHITPARTTGVPITGDTSQCVFCAHEQLLFGDIIPPPAHHLGQQFADGRHYTDGRAWASRALPTALSCVCLHIRIRRQRWRWRRRRRRRRQQRQMLVAG